MGPESNKVTPETQVQVKPFTHLYCFAAANHGDSCSPEVVEFHYEQSAPLYGCRSCERKGEQKTTEEHVLARHHEGPAPFTCSECQKTFTQETKARTHVTKGHSGHTFKQIIKKDSSVDLLNSGARLLTKEEGKAYIHESILRKQVRVPLKRKAKAEPEDKVTAPPRDEEAAGVPEEGETHPQPEEAVLPQAQDPHQQQMTRQTHLHRASTPSLPVQNHPQPSPWYLQLRACTRSSSATRRWRTLCSCRRWASSSPPHVAPWPKKRSRKTKISKHFSIPCWRNRPWIARFSTVYYRARENSKPGWTQSVGSVASAKTR